MDDERPGVYMYGLFELRDGTLKAAYLGNSSQILHFLRQLVKSKIDHKILSLADARFSSNSPLGALTEKQRRVLLSAFKLGYFEIPRKIGFARMSRQMNLGRSTVNEHLRKAESHLISQILVQ
jgi:predicted DNA binding protein